MYEIGGYFPLELKLGMNFHPQAYAMNSGRNCLRILIRQYKVSKLYIPTYICNEVINAIKLEKIDIGYYPINDQLEPILDVELAENEFILLVNYFGIKSGSIFKNSQLYSNVFIDQCQSFFSPPNEVIPSFYSPRKFFGVPDGGYVYGAIPDNAIPQGSSIERFSHLIGRIEKGAQYFYGEYYLSEALLGENAPMCMSQLTLAVLDSIDYESIAATRRDNYTYLHGLLSNYNALSIDLFQGEVPMVYPFLLLDSNKAGLRDHLRNQGIYVAKYWHDISSVSVVEEDRSEYLSSNLTPLPIDQRYTSDDMEIVAQSVLSFLTA